MINNRSGIRLDMRIDAHPAAAQLLDDAVVRNGLADHGWRVRSRLLLGMLQRRVNEGGLPTLADQYGESSVADRIAFG